MGLPGPNPLAGAIHEATRRFGMGAARAIDAWCRAWVAAYGTWPEIVYERTSGGMDRTWLREYRGDISREVQRELLRELARGGDSRIPAMVAERPGEFCMVPSCDGATLRMDWEMKP